VSNLTPDNEFQAKRHERTADELDQMILKMNDFYVKLFIDERDTGMLSEVIQMFVEESNSQRKLAELYRKGEL
jgi:hypothetical protein